MFFFFFVHFFRSGWTKIVFFSLSRVCVCFSYKRRVRNKFVMFLFNSYTPKRKCNKSTRDENGKRKTLKEKYDTSKLTYLRLMFVRGMCIFLFLLSAMCFNVFHFVRIVFEIWCLLSRFVLCWRVPTQHNRTNQKLRSLLSEVWFWFMCNNFVAHEAAKCNIFREHTFEQFLSFEHFAWVSEKEVVRWLIILFISDAVAISALFIYTLCWFFLLLLMLMLFCLNFFLFVVFFSHFHSWKTCLRMWCKHWSPSNEIYKVIASFWSRAEQASEQTKKNSNHVCTQNFKVNVCVSVFVCHFISARAILPQITLCKDTLCASECKTN